MCYRGPFFNCIKHLIITSGLFWSDDNYIRWCGLTSYQELCAAPLYPRSADAAADDDDACDDVEDDDVDDVDDEDDDEDDLEDDLDPGP